MTESWIHYAYNFIDKSNFRIYKLSRLRSECISQIIVVLLCIVLSKWICESNATLAYTHMLY